MKNRLTIIVATLAFSATAYCETFREAGEIACTVENALLHSQVKRLEELSAAQAKKIDLLEKKVALLEASPPKQAGAAK